ncbi:MAG: phosphopantothenoylcysteine decarboxylase [bacterium]
MRFISNPSSGKTGYYLANAALSLGLNVIFLSGKSAYMPQGAEIIEVTSALEMMEKFKENFKRADIIIGAAAVGDFTLQRRKGKIKREGQKNLLIELKPTEDIMAWAGKNKGKKMLVGYSAQSGKDLSETKRKMKSKNLDMIVFNDISKKDVGFGSDENEIIIIGKQGKALYEGRQSKEKLAEIIMELIYRKEK